jgi:NAD(P)-dependent dehydrogenase (short-subunit alcohol dehydrogenase family)
VTLIEPRPSIYPAIDPEPLYAARSYSGKVVLVTGASRGVGRETALQYARAGASVAILARTRDALDETRDLIVAAVSGADVLVLAADVRDAESVRAAVESVLRRFGKLDILIANAGAITAFTPSENRTLSPFASFVCLETYCSYHHQSAEQKRPGCVVEHLRG